ncbi:Cathepsin B [Balamuthia mandrillaris]
MQHYERLFFLLAAAALCFSALPTVFGQGRFLRALGLASLDIDPDLCPPKTFKGDVPLPDSFDAREEWSGCISGITDQGSCGSCWAVSTSQWDEAPEAKDNTDGQTKKVLSDRFCISSNSTVRKLMSAQHQVDCDSSCKQPVLGTSCNSGCNGGYMDQAFIYLGEEGTVGESCKSYVGEDETCSDFVCDSGETTATTFYAEGCNQVISVEHIKREIYENGPVVAGFTVYEDFYDYDGGVYDTQEGSAEGGHAIRMLGWGEEDGKPYWLCANSWGTDWGENGYFKILRGENHLGIESYVVTSSADMERVDLDSSDLQDDSDDFLEPSDAPSAPLSFFFHYCRADKK